MEFPILFKNVSENFSEFYKADERDSNIIGFVNPDNTNEFGYIISGGRQYGLSYQTLKSYIDTTYNNSIKYADNINTTLSGNLKTLESSVLQNRNNINSLSTTVTQNLNDAKAYAASTAENTKNNAKAYTTTVISETKTYIIDRMMNYSTEEMRNCSDTTHAANINAIRVNQTTLKTYLIGSVSIKVRAGSSISTASYMIVKIPGASSYIAKSINTIKQSDYSNKYVTWYFDTFLIRAATRYDFQLVDDSGRLVTMTPHVIGNYTNNDLVCIGPANYERPDFSPAFGVNLSNIYAKDIAVTKTSIEELSQSISYLNTSVSNLSALVEHLYASSGITKPTNMPTL